MIPAAKGLRADDLSCFKMDLRLIPDLDFSVRHGGRQVIADIRNLLAFLPLIRIVEFIAVLTGIPHLALGDPGAIQHTIHINFLVVLRGQHINA